ncbi:MAG: HAMP domain-containing protein [Candidatus Omnitrophica bacterium]|nr:HAMP domain-containing protein [Candidatus Omnitrophota bacterium]
MKFNSLRFKASILYSAILALILIIFSTIIFFSVHKILYQDLDEELRIKAEEIAEILNAYNKVKLTEESATGRVLKILRGEDKQSDQRMIVDDLWKSKLNILNLKNDFINILNIRGAVLLNSNNFKGDVETLFKTQFPFVLNHVVYKNLSNEKYRLRAINLPVKFYNSTLIIQVGASETSVINLLYKLLMFMVITVFLLLIFTSFVGRIFVNNALRPVKEVSALAKTISHKDLNQRIEEKKIDIEMKQLVTSFNSMISRLDKSFGHINEFSSLAAHELKTPLAILRGEIELALESDKTVEDYKNLLDSNLEEIDHMIRVVKDLLLLAKLDYKPEIFKFENLRLKSFLEEIYEHSKILAETRNIKISKDLKVDNVLINADKVHLRRLFLI